MSDFKVILEHADACGLVGEKKVKASFLNSASGVLLCRGASKILIPAPGEHEFERISVGIEDMPKERRGAVQIVDRNGAILRKVYDYIAPLKDQANKWPEDTYVRFLESFLYQIGIASKYEAGIIGNTVQILREFIPIINPMLFKGEARYRLAETIDLVCRYEPTRPNHGMLHYEIAEKGISERLWSIIETAEFRTIVAESGKLGYAKNPLIGIKKISNLFADLIRKPEVKPILGIAHTAAELSGLGIPADSVEKIVGAVEEQQKEGRFFSPSFPSLGPAELPIYRIALAERYPGAVPPKDSIMLFERSRDSRIRYSWLNVGEEEKLKKEAKIGLKHQLSLLAKCKRVQSQFYG